MGINMNHTIERCPHDKENPYAQISRELLRDKNISFQVRGFLAYCLSFDSSWKISIPYFRKENGLCKDTMYRLIDKAIESGYMKRETYKEGNLKRTKYYVSESPKFKKCFPCPEKPDPDIHDPEKQEFKKCFRRPEKRDPETQDSTKEQVSSYEDKNNDISPPIPPLKSSPEAQKLSENLQYEISCVNTHFNDLTANWPKIFEQLLKKKSFSHLSALICWIFKDDFWRSVIVSPNGIKKNIAKLESKMETEKCNPNYPQKKYEKEMKPFREEPTHSRKRTLVQDTETPEEAQQKKALLDKMFKPFGIG